MTLPALLEHRYHFSHKDRSAHSVSLQRSKLLTYHTPHHSDDNARSPLVDRGRKAIDILFDLKKFIAPFSEAAQMPPAKGEGPLLLTLSAR